MDLCNAPLRKKPGQFCRAPVLKGRRRCRLHAGRPANVGSREGQAATEAGYTAYVAKRRAAKARGEPVKRYGGRRKRWLIPRPWRFALSEADQLAVLTHMAAYDIRVRGGEPRPPWEPITSQRAEAKALADLERSLIIAMNDAARPLPREGMERLYDLARGAEHAFGLPGADVRVKRLAWERERFLLRGLPALAPADCAADPAPAPLGSEWPASRRPPPDDFRDQLVPPYTVESADQLRVETNDHKWRLAQFGSLPESTARCLDAELTRAGSEVAQLAVLDRWIDSMERAYAMTERIVAGRDVAAEQRAMRPRQEERRLTIKP
jgi:hypothetical protein